MFRPFKGEVVDAVVTQVNKVRFKMFVGHVHSRNTMVTTGYEILNLLVSFHRCKKYKRQTQLQMMQEASQIFKKDHLKRAVYLSSVVVCSAKM